MARLRLFANLRELAGASEVEIPGDTVGAILGEAAHRYGPEFERSLQAARVWLNGDQADAGDPVTDADEMALIPPVSGGADRPMLTVSGIGAGRESSSFYTYEQGRAAEIDRTIELAEDYDIKLVMTIWTHDALRDFNHHTWRKNGSWGKAFDEKVDEVVANLCSKPAHALRMGKSVMNRSFEGIDMDSALAVERNAICWLVFSPEIQQVLAAVKEGKF